MNWPSIVIGFQRFNIIDPAVVNERRIIAALGIFNSPLEDMVSYPAAFTSEMDEPVPFSAFTPIDPTLTTRRFFFTLVMN